MTAGGAESGLSLEGCEIRPDHFKALVTELIQNVLFWLFFMLYVHVVLVGSTLLKKSAHSNIAEVKTSHVS